MLQNVYLCGARCARSSIRITLDASRISADDPMACLMSHSLLSLCTSHGRISTDCMLLHKHMRLIPGRFPQFDRNRGISCFAGVWLSGQFNGRFSNTHSVVWSGSNLQCTINWICFSSHFPPPPIDTQTGCRVKRTKIALIKGPQNWSISGSDNLKVLASKCSNRRESPLI